ncbi:MAG TPA: hypothetical protein VHS99_05785 [Chloroflexota bacterium]|nr:hypothetical protein [Chloroflexota bacterium]
MTGWGRVDRRSGRGLGRRALHRAVAGGLAAAGLAGSGGLGGGVVAGAAPAGVVPLEAVLPASNVGVNEAFRAMPFARLCGAGWTRWTVQWFNLQPAPGPLNAHYFRDAQGRSVLEESVRQGMKVAAMVLGTPEWAAQTPGLKAGSSVPRGLYEPVFVDGRPNQANTWGAFIFQLAESYRGLLDVLEIWNEVELPAHGSNAMYHTWAGSPADYYQLLKVASLAAKAANPGARIVTAPYAYFRDKQEGRAAALPFFEGFVAALRADPLGASVFDVFALNAYRNPHDLWDRFYGGGPQLVEAADRVGFRARLDALGAGDKPIWITETNSMPYDDPLPGWDPASRNDRFRITLDEQASYVLQAYALGLCAGYEKVFFQAMQDDPYPVPDELWGLVRHSGERENADPARVRPAFVAYQLAARYLGDADRSQLFVQLRPDSQGYARYVARYAWAAHLAVFQKGTRRTSVLWNGTAEPLPVALRSWGAAAGIVDKYGQTSPVTPDERGHVHLTLGPASRHFDLFGGDPPGYFYVGGSPLLVVEEGVPSDAPVEAPGFQPA